MLQPSTNPDKIQEITNDQEVPQTTISQGEELVKVYQNLAQTTALLNQKNREIDQFTYIASHDLKAPLRAIANLSQWLEDDLSGKIPPENEQQLQLLRSRVQRMENLLDGLLAYSRAGHNNSTDEVVDVGQLLTQVIDSLMSPTSFTIEVEPGMPTLTTNKRSQLTQVFTHLISNAIEHHHGCDGHIRISVQDQGEVYQFIVSDDGPGIAPEYHEKIFRMFQTLEARDQKENAGVGLSIVKKILDSEGGQITVKSQPGCGSSFCFSWHK
ncbi:MAG: ATP-binding protein [Nostocaceae cyanobacterium]|nr:ATP-binding protein [Nostocaceae cyanobacterium]